MKRSEHAVLTTHTGSLPRPEALLGLLAERDRGPEQRAAFNEAAAAAVASVVARQAELGLDVVSDGEQSKPSYATYVKDRLSGFDGSSQSKEPLGPTSSTSQAIARCEIRRPCSARPAPDPSPGRTGMRSSGTSPTSRTHSAERT